VALSRVRTKLIHRLSDRKGRRREGAVLVEGHRVAEEVLRSGAAVRFAVASDELEASDRGRRLATALREAGVEEEVVSAGELTELSDTEEPQGIALIVDEPSGWLPERAEGRPLLIADAVQNPGNLGTLARTARAFGVSGVVALDGTVDPWNPKCVRASAGAFFHMGVARMDWPECAAALDAGGYTLHAGAMDGEAVESVTPGDAWALAIGNEGRGVRPELAARARPVSVPMSEGTESLNAAVAGAILLYALSRSPS